MVGTGMQGPTDAPVFHCPITSAVTHTAEVAMTPWRAPGKSTDARKQVALRCSDGPRRRKKRSFANVSNRIEAACAGQARKPPISGRCRHLSSKHFFPGVVNPKTYHARQNVVNSHGQEIVEPGTASRGSRTRRTEREPHVRIGLENAPSLPSDHGDQTLISRFLDDAR